jgi:hypothetical protein
MHREKNAGGRVSDLIVRALHQMTWPPRTFLVLEFYAGCLSATQKLHKLGVHQEVAEQVFRTRFHDLETWGVPGSWVAANLCTWLQSLIQTARGRSGARREALVIQAKEVAARVVPLLGGGWDDCGYEGDHTCTVRLGWDGTHAVAACRI